MRKNKHLAATVAAAMAVATLAGTSAFAETRHSQETRRGGDARETVRRERTQEAARSDGSRSDERRQSEGSARTERRQATAESYRREAAREPRADRREATAETYRREAARGAERRDDRRGDRGTYDRNGGANRNGGYDRNDAHRNGGYDRNGGYNRNGGYDRNRGYDSSRGRTYHHSGRITNCSPYGNGYRVWVAGAPYPFFIPLSHWHRDRFRIGLMINLGGYWNPGGYYDYYDDYDDYYDGYSYRSTSRGDLRGVVESVDYGRDTFVVRNEATGSYVTVIARDRRAYDVRPGDYVELSGTWTRSGLFSAYDVDLLDYDRYPY